VFRKVIIPGQFLDTGEFNIETFVKVIVDIPREFRLARWGYGHYYGRFYGHCL